MQHRTAVIVALASALLIGACGGGASASSGPSASPGPSDRTSALDGRTFLATKVEGRVLVAGSQLSLRFGDGQIGASAGCNSMSGPYAIDGDHLVINALATTEMACDPLLMEQDSWLAAFLGGATLVLEGDTLVLDKAGARLTLLDREVADPDRPLFGTHWVVDGILSGGAVSSVPVGVTATVIFGDGHVDVEAGCNSGGGRVQITASTLAFGAIGLTRKTCGQGAMAVEQAVTAVLSGMVSYTIEAGILTLIADGHGLTLQAAP